MPIDFSDFNEFNIEKIKEWESLQYTDADIARWKQHGVLVEKLYEFKMKKLFLEYLKVKLENELAASDPFCHYDPILEAENILRQNFSQGKEKEEGQDVV